MKSIRACSVFLLHVFSAWLWLSDDIKNTLDEAKRKAASANESASNTMDKLNAMKIEIDKINLSPVDADINNVLNDVDQSGKI